MPPDEDRLEDLPRLLVLELVDDLGSLGVERLPVEGVLLEDLHEHGPLAGDEERPLDLPRTRGEDGIEDLLPRAEAGDGAVLPECLRGLDLQSELGCGCLE